MEHTTAQRIASRFAGLPSHGRADEAARIRRLRCRSPGAGDVGIVLVENGIQLT